MDSACSISHAWASNCCRSYSNARISDDAALPPEAILDNEDRIDSDARVACVNGWEGLDLCNVRDGVSIGFCS